VLIPDSEINKLIEEVDANKDGEIDYLEFLAMMEKGGRKSQMK
jgi:Ca2+-binding EF-hand superfamily protein